MISTDKQAYLIFRGNRIKQLRETKGMTLDELADKCGYTSDNKRSSIQKIEAGKADFPSSKISLFADALGVSINEIMCWDNPSNIERVQKEVAACELFQECYGKEAFLTVASFLKLDSYDRSAVTTMIQSLLSSGKYERE